MTSMLFDLKTINNNNNTSNNNNSSTGTGVWTKKEHTEFYQYVTKYGVPTDGWKVVLTKTKSLKLKTEQQLQAYFIHYLARCNHYLGDMNNTKLKPKDATTTTSTTTTTTTTTTTNTSTATTSIIVASSSNANDIPITLASAKKFVVRVGFFKDLYKCLKVENNVVIAMGVSRAYSNLWTPGENDIALLRGLAKHGYASYQEIMSDPTLPFYKIYQDKVASSSTPPAAEDILEVLGYSKYEMASRIVKLVTAILDPLNHSRPKTITIDPSTIPATTSIKDILGDRNKQIVYHVQLLSYAHKKGKLSKELFIKHLTMLYGSTQATKYYDTVVAAPMSSIPVVTYENGPIEYVLARTPHYRRLIMAAIQHQQLANHCRKLGQLYTSLLIGKPKLTEHLVMLFGEDKGRMHANILTTGVARDKAGAEVTAKDVQPTLSNTPRFRDLLNNKFKQQEPIKELYFEPLVSGIPNYIEKTTAVDLEMYEDSVIRHINLLAHGLVHNLVTRMTLTEHLEEIFGYDTDVVKYYMRVISAYPSSRCSPPSQLDVSQALERKYYISKFVSLLRIYGKTKLPAQDPVVGQQPLKKLAPTAKPLAKPGAKPVAKPSATIVAKPVATTVAKPVAITPLTVTPLTSTSTSTTPPSSPSFHIGRPAGQSSPQSSPLQRVSSPPLIQPAASQSSPQSSPPLIQPAAAGQSSPPVQPSQPQTKVSMSSVPELTEVSNHLKILLFMHHYNKIDATILLNHFSMIFPFTAQQKLSAMQKQAVKFPPLPPNFNVQHYLSLTPTMATKYRNHVIAQRQQLAQQSPTPK
ncbi:hypothetical protein DFA_00616 [Cavenderia fasciculata]|uniref:Myb-like domain-containing protein n=1 Tax=Cavenderia fasciculata TaxID=261658 RepID=F4PSW4_CACFS|nr:uncharacterized protein DFA_00616 [Cavenderia fasciculata]EGG20753.1 hypothetical protein DFA_00616 [Cavenderia fasciculata]|eukprot:XP_004358603.1 hypothetical protein DFA_00616 [Cavenderia fasciculata]